MFCVAVPSFFDLVSGFQAWEHDHTFDLVCRFGMAQLPCCLFSGMSWRGLGGMVGEVWGTSSGSVWRECERFLRSLGRCLESKKR